MAKPPHNPERIEVIEAMIALSERMVFPVDRENAISLVTLVLHHLDAEWSEAGSWQEGAYKVWQILHTRRKEPTDNTHWYDDYDEDLGGMMPYRA